jgi:serine/threonine protein kinase
MFEAIQKIGKGSSCQVYTVLNKNDHKVYAIKQSSSQENEVIIKNEVAIFKIFNNECPYIIKYYDFFKGKNESNQPCLCIQLEYCEYGNIREIIKQGRKRGVKIGELEISSIIYMVLKGINFIHSKNLINRDIKGRNILVGEKGIVKLCDFGICKEYKENKMKKYRGGSPYWMAPEILKKEEYNQNVDIWAIGITCIELAEFEPPYSKFNPETVIKKIIESPPKGLNDPSKWSPIFNDFISCCLNVDKKKRPFSDELLKHEFITMIDKKNLNRNLIIYKFLSKCGYKVLYNKKERIPININNKKNVFYHKPKIENKDKYAAITHIDSVENLFTKKNPNNAIYINKNIIKQRNRNFSPIIVNNNPTQSESFTYKNFNKKVYFRPRSVEKIINDDSGKKNDIHFFACNTSSDYHSKSNYKKNNNNVIYLNITNYKNINPIIGNNTYNKYADIINEENDNNENQNENENEEEIENEVNEFNIEEQIINSKIESLEKERDFIVKNIMDEYQDKISKISQEKKNLIKRPIKNENLRNNRNLAKKGANTVENFKKINIKGKRRNDGSSFSMSSK